jgi:hypothetical protein
MMKLRLPLQSESPANDSGSGRNGFPRGKNIRLFAAFAVSAAFFSVYRALNFRSTLDRWSSLSLSTAMAKTYEKSASFLGGAITNERTVYFLEAEASELSDEDLATGMWWQSVASFTKFPITEVRFGNQSASSLASTTGAYAAASGVHRDRALMTRDWLDFAVESVGLYHNHFFGNSMNSSSSEAVDAGAGADADDTFYPILRQQLQTYFDDTQRHENDQPSLELTAPQQTIAVIPFTQHGSDSNSTSNKQLSASQRQHFLELRVQALAATLISLQRVGMGRAIVVGLSDVDKEWVLSAFERVEQDADAEWTMSVEQFLDDSEALSLSMQLAFVIAPGVTPEVIQNSEHTSLSLGHLLQKQALHGLDVALRGSPSLLGAPLQSWLGEKSSADTAQWQYVYWTQPNLLLHARASSLPVLQEALDQGAILTAHRLPVIPHVSDFAVASKSKQASLALVPAIDSFATIMTLDSVIAACCDAGSGRPALEITQPDCASDTPWWQCGLSASTITQSDRVTTDPHRRKVPYSWIRLRNPGLGLVLMSASESARMCTPVTSGSCAADGSIVYSSLLSSLSSWVWGVSEEDSEDESNAEQDDNVDGDSTEAESDGSSSASNDQSSVKQPTKDPTKQPTKQPTKAPIE